ncbi:UDP-N-acetylglucosamine diphosphorylase/glucosamine-1-phosphate N-acetyltransferase [Mucilaginibacter lappiensis]|uniref:UDP-N-acetylglucosamine diphosphorylase/glucosamine-1-phosphate N-acetyltransferase n=1 Tax=Mucilaginibacter lappiensis TaxID=354630 RepID=A0ABR6PWC5_9SPHI|nr:GlmU family protein [Mucilaginibacter lappiensis]MBB6112636.1 UDP-N-acetylglucosamine diphosphorylase/glucosamine-1-phosphate N-acetyltransferase [Mucilaginibacter lappiensis]SIS04760.1 UDP-N-acetylglucosamine diphosphorylase/glucosamine-1-phosphate N-acetyltransferase [Mucilaginibacter lappiensis]
MSIILFDDNARQTLLPLTYTRPVADLRIGILTIAEKWAKYLNTHHSFYTADYLQTKYPAKIGTDNLFINGAVCPDDNLLEAIDKLQTGQALKYNGQLLAVRLNQTDAVNFKPETEFHNVVNYSNLFVAIRYPEDIFRKNDIELRKDFRLLTKGRSSAAVSPTNVIIGNDFFAEEGAVAECSTFNTTNGPIYLSNNTEVWEGTHIRGAFAICEHSQVKMGTKIYGATTVGPYSRVGGEINNAVIWGYSSKGHEGYLGNSVLGEWCNIGADSNNSNLKNNYAEVKLWDYTSQDFRKTGLQFCGLIMADHAKCSINTMFNTGSVVGVGANVFGAGFPRNFVPDFSWGGAAGLEVYVLNKMLETAQKVFERREHRQFNQMEQDLLKQIFELTEEYRKF